MKTAIHQRLEETQGAVDRVGKAFDEARTAWDVALEKLAIAEAVLKEEKRRRLRAALGLETLKGGL